LLLEPSTSIDYVPCVSTLRKVTAARAVAIGGMAVALSLALGPGVHAAATERAGAPIRGLDISAYQHAGTPIDWARLATQGIQFVSIKASEGTYYRNPHYVSDARAAAAAGLRVMPYVFANPSRGGGAATASYAAAALHAVHGPFTLPLVVDLENDPYKKKTDCYKVGIPAMIGWITRFTQRAKALTGRWPIIYTTADWWRECTGSSGNFPHDPLWLAAFGGTAPTVPSPWQNWTFWQYDNAGSLPGIGHTDLDYYHPTDGLPALRAPAKAKAKPTRPKPAKGKRAKTKKHTATAKKHATTAKPRNHQKSAAKTHPSAKAQPKKQPEGENKPKPNNRRHHGRASQRYPGKLG
jgi:GH25 family lysozyme M1 (1,4-beta-N-acetylmuramidase)